MAEAHPATIAREPAGVICNSFLGGYAPPASLEVPGALYCPPNKKWLTYAVSGSLARIMPGQVIRSFSRELEAPLPTVATARDLAGSTGHERRQRRRRPRGATRGTGVKEAGDGRAGAPTGATSPEWYGHPRREPTATEAPTA